MRDSANLSLFQTVDRIAELGAMQDRLMDSDERKKRVPDLRRRSFELLAASIVDIAASPDCVLKVFRERADTSSADLFRRLERERSFLASNNNRFITGIVDYGGIINGAQFNVYPLYQQGSLDAYSSLLKGDLRSCLTVYRSALHALQEIHSKGLVHRDIKPANLFLGQEGRVVVGDFGLLSRNDNQPSVTLTGLRVGAWQFAPEWDVAVSEDFAFDLYMLGKTLWCIASGNDSLSREDWNLTRSDLKLLFPASEPAAQLINTILAKTVVRERSDVRVGSTAELAEYVESETRKLWGHVDLRLFI
jgi:serine/threonine protein kinase